MTIMKKNLILSLLLLSNLFVFGQDNPKKPNYVIVAGNQIITKEKVDSLFKFGYLKSIAKGVSEKVRDSLFKKYGNQIGDKEFVVIITLNTEAERQQNRATQANGNEKADSAVENNEFLVKVNEVAPNFIVKMINGKTIKLSELKGRVVLINFWATWCAPCLMEFYDFQSKIINRYKGSDFSMLPISRGETMQNVKAKMDALKKDSIDFSVGIDPDESIWKLYAKGEIPKNILVDKNGIIRYLSTGYDDKNLDKIASIIDKLLKE